MIITFRSDAAGDVIMFGDVARRMMTLMGKEPADQGIVTVAQLPAALVGLRAAVAAEKARLQQVAEEDLPRFETDADGRRRPYVSLAQRAAPLIELLEWSLRQGKPVVWGA